MADDADSPGPITSLESSTQGQLLNRICEAIIDLALPGIDGNVWIRDPPTIAGIETPCVILNPYTPSHSPADGTTSQADVTFRVMAGVVKAVGGVVNQSLGERLQWYDTLFKAFAKRSDLRFTDDVAAAGWKWLYSNVEPGDPRIYEAWQIGYDAEFLSISNYVRAPAYSD